MRNKAQFSKDDLIAIFGETSLYNFNNIKEVKGVSTDTREIFKGNIFIALKGENHDAHDYIDEAVNNGASCIVVNKKWYDYNNCNYPIIVVDDTLEALGNLANYHRNRFDLKLICIGGSNGKTTTKEMIASILSRKYKTLKTYRNFNNRIGVPIMLFQLDETYEAAVIEIATNQPGEISLLSEIAAPNYGLITNIGKEHLEQLMDLRGVELEETFLFGYLRNRGYSIINIDDEILRKYTKVIETGLTYGQTKDAMIQAKIELSNELSPLIDIKFNEDKFQIKLNTFGYVTALNAIAAIAAGYALDVEKEDIIKGLESYIPDPETKYGRMRFQEVNGYKIINDCYNANPASMRASLDTLASYHLSRKRIALLGDMLELGRCSIDEHINLIKIAQNKADIIFLYGNEFKIALEKIDDAFKIYHISEKENIREYVNTLIKKGYVILLKGSRGMKMEEFLNYF